MADAIGLGRIDEKTRSRSKLVEHNTAARRTSLGDPLPAGRLRELDLPDSHHLDDQDIL
jgi:hypothetical protein